MERRSLLLALLLLLAQPGSARLADAILGYDGLNHGQMPALLSGTRLYVDMAAKPRQVTAGIFPFEVNSPLWSDGSHKERFVSVPPGTKIAPTDTDHYEFPDKTVLIKNFAIDTVYGDSATRILVETRFLVFRKSASGGGWHGLTYAWRRDQTDADKVGDRGLTAVHNVRMGNGLQGKRWRYPAGAECGQCHVGRGALGFITPQLNRPMAGNPAVNQMRDLLDKGVLATDPLVGKVNPFRWVGIEEMGASLEHRARSYFGSNCSHCHGNDQFMGPSHDFDYLTPARKIGYGENPSGGYVGKPGNYYPSLIHAGFPDSSEIISKMNTREGLSGGANLQMPPLATYQLDSAALQTMRKWVCSLGGRDTLSAACKLPQGAPDHTFWSDPVALRRLSPHGPMVREWKARITGDILRIDAMGNGPASGLPVHLFDSRGKFIPMEPIGPGAYRLPAGLDHKGGAYFLRQGASLIALEASP